MVEVRSGETTKTLLMALFYFLVIFSITVVKPVRNSLFLSELGAAKLPYIYLVTAAFTGLLVFVDSKLSSVLNRVTFMSATLGFLLLNLLWFWWWMRWPEKWVFAFFYVWVSLFTTVLVAHFWTFANDYFHPREAKRLFGLVGTGGILGGIVAGLTADFSVPSVFSTEDLLLFAAATLVLSIFVVRLIEKYVPRRVFARKKLAPNPQTHHYSGKMFQGLTNRRLLILLGLMIAFGMTVSTLIDFQFNSIVEASYPTKFARTEFFGKFFALLGLISLFVQLFLSSKILRKFGIGLALALLPLILALGSVGLLVLPTILLASFLKLTDKSLNFSLNRSSRELLFIPMPSEVRLKAKLIIDVFINRFAGGLAACLILVFTLIFSFTVQQLSLVAIIVLVAWVGTTLALRKEYVNSIKRLLVRRDVDFEARVIETLDAETVAALRKSLHSPDHQIVRYALTLLHLVPKNEIVDDLKPLLKHWDAKIRAQALRMLFGSGENLLEEITPLLSDDDIEVRSEAIHFVWAHCNDCPSDRIDEFLGDPDPRIKGAMLASLINHTKQLTPRGKSILVAMLRDQSEFGEAQRIEAAKILGAIDHGFDLHENLAPLLNDASLSVQQIAIASAGKVQHDEFVLLLIAKLGDRRIRRSVRNALANYGNRILPILTNVLNDSKENRHIRQNIPRVLFEIGTQESWTALVDSLGIKNQAFRYEVIKSLNKVRKTAPDWPVDRTKVNKVLREEIREYYRKLNIFHVYGRKDRLVIEMREVDDILYPALQEKLDEGLERIFRLLALLYPSRDIHNSYYFLAQGDKEERANALELLDNLLPNGLKIRLLPILEEIPLNYKVRQGRAFYNLSRFSRTEALRALLDENDLWLKACTIYRITQERISGCTNKIRPYLKSSEPLLQEVARRYFQRRVNRAPRSILADVY
ncbi:MAG: Npt1/Npt2 family nucleotide transporter [bacterium]